MRLPSESLTPNENNFLFSTDTYAGPEPFSEKETKALVEFYATIADKTEAYIAFHAPQQLLLYPMGHDNSTELVPNVEDLVKLEFKFFFNTYVNYSDRI